MWTRWYAVGVPERLGKAAVFQPAPTRATPRTGAPLRDALAVRPLRIAREISWKTVGAATAHVSLVALTRLKPHSGHVARFPWEASVVMTTHRAPSALARARARPNNSPRNPSVR